MESTSMDAGARGWLVKTAAQNYWKVSGDYELEDLIQEGMVCWYRVVEKYEQETGRVRLRPHLMALFKRTYLNRIQRISIERNVRSCEVRAEDVVRAPGDIRMSGSDKPGGAYEVWDALGCTSDVSDYERLIAEAPKSLQYILRKLMRAVPDRGWASLYRLYEDGTRQTLNAKLCRVIGIDPQRYDVATALREYLSR